MKNHSVYLPWPPKELSPNAKLHWAKKMKFKKSYREICWALTLEAQLIAPKDGRFPVKITFYPPDKRHRDADNMIASMKAGFDGVADALKVDDKLFRPTFLFSDEVKGMVKFEIEFPGQDAVA